VCFFAPWAIFIITLTLGILVAQRAAAAQQLVKVHRIGVLMYNFSSSAIEELRQGLHESGYVEGQNLAIEYRWGEGKNERLPELAADLVRQSSRRQRHGRDVFCQHARGKTVGIAARAIPERKGYRLPHQSAESHFGIANQRRTGCSALIRPKDRKLRARWQRADQLLIAHADVAAVTRQVEAAVIYDGKLDVSVTA